jgi:hypothetical protein
LRPKPKKCSMKRLNLKAAVSPAKPLSRLFLS